MTLTDRMVGDLGDKRRWRECRARVKALSASHRATVEALDESRSAIERAEAEHEDERTRS